MSVRRGQPALASRTLGIDLDALPTRDKAALRLLARADGATASQLALLILSARTDRPLPAARPVACGCSAGSRADDERWSHSRTSNMRSTSVLGRALVVVQLPQPAYFWGGGRNRKGLGMRMPMRSFAVVVATAALGSLLTMASPAMAGGSSTAWPGGTVNCNGSMTTYTTQRKLTGWSTTDLYLTAAAYSDGNIFSGGPYTSMTLGIKIVKTGVIMDQGITGAGRWVTFDTSNYLPTTVFVMRAAMHASVGTCHNSWAGTLYF